MSLGRPFFGAAASTPHDDDEDALPRSAPPPAPGHAPSGPLPTRGGGGLANASQSRILQPLAWQDIVSLTSGGSRPETAGADSSKGAGLGGSGRGGEPGRSSARTPPPVTAGMPTPRPASERVVSQSRPSTRAPVSVSVVRATRDPSLACASSGQVAAPAAVPITSSSSSQALPSQRPQPPEVEPGATVPLHWGSGDEVFAFAGRVPARPPGLAASTRTLGASSTASAGIPTASTSGPLAKPTARPHLPLSEPQLRSSADILAGLESLRATTPSGRDTRQGGQANGPANNLGELGAWVDRDAALWAREAAQAIAAAQVPVDLAPSEHRYSGLVPLEEDAAAPMEVPRLVGKQLHPAWVAGRELCPSFSDLWDPAEHEPEVASTKRLHHPPPAFTAAGLSEGYLLDAQEEYSLNCRTGRCLLAMLEDVQMSLY
eukprot:jgi/Mesvir1/17269/Mv07677-RA.1